MAIQGVYLSLLIVIFTLKGLVQISLEQLDSNKINCGEKNMKKIAIGMVALSTTKNPLKITT